MHHQLHLLLIHRSHTHHSLEFTTAQERKDTNLDDFNWVTLQTILPIPIIHQLILRQLHPLQNRPKKLKLLLLEGQSGIRPVILTPHLMLQLQLKTRGIIVCSLTSYHIYVPQFYTASNNIALGLPKQKLFVSITQSQPVLRVTLES